MERFSHTMIPEHKRKYHAFQSAIFGAICIYFSISQLLESSARLPKDGNKNEKHALRVFFVADGCKSNKLLLMFLFSSIGLRTSSCYPRKAPFPEASEVFRRRILFFHQQTRRIAALGRAAGEYLGHVNNTELVAPRTPACKSMRERCPKRICAAAALSHLAAAAEEPTRCRI